MADSLMANGGGEVRRHLDRAEVLRATVEQLRKDLAIGPEELTMPEVGEGAFEHIRGQVLERLEAWSTAAPASLSRAINRVDITERMVNDAMAHGGLHELAGTMVLRCLQKVLIRKRFAGLI